MLETSAPSNIPPSPTLESHNLIRKAKGFFQTKFDQQYQEINDPREGHQWALRILRVLTNHISVVAVVSDDEDNAANVFETLNDRGIGLSTPDLLRNLILRRAAEEDQDEIIDLWGEILEIEGDVKLKTFLRHYWISNEGDVRTQGLYREIKDNVTSNDVHSLEFSRGLRDSSIIYRDILSAQDPDDDISQILKDINDLGANLLYPAILSAYEVGDQEQLRTFLHALLVTFVRHNVIGRLENSLLEDIIFPLARTLRQDRDFNAAIQTLRNFSPDDESFINAFHTVSISRQASARYILRELEMSLRRTEELEVSTPARVHVEHIYPKTPRPGERWNNHVHIVDRLGNRTLLSRRLNTAIKNAPFPEKRTFYERSELQLTQGLLQYDDWTPVRIEQRQIELSENVANIWTFPEI